MWDLTKFKLSGNKSREAAEKERKKQQYLM